MNKQGRPMGHKLSEETLAKMRESSRLRWENADEEKRKSWYVKKRQPVRTPDGEFESRDACAKHYGISPVTVKNRVGKTTGKYAEWVYVDQAKEQQ